MQISYWHKTCFLRSCFPLDCGCVSLFLKTILLGEFSYRWVYRSEHRATFWSGSPLFVPACHAHLLTDYQLLTSCLCSTNAMVSFKSDRALRKPYNVSNRVLPLSSPWHYPMSFFTMYHYSRNHQGLRKVTCSTTKNPTWISMHHTPQENYLHPASLLTSSLSQTSIMRSMRRI